MFTQTLELCLIFQFDYKTFYPSTFDLTKYSLRHFWHTLNLSKIDDTHPSVIWLLSYSYLSKQQHEWYQNFKSNTHKEDVQWRTKYKTTLLNKEYRLNLNVWSSKARLYKSKFTALENHLLQKLFTCSAVWCYLKQYTEFPFIGVSS